VKKFSDKPFALIGVHLGSDAKKVKEVMDQEKLPWRSFVDSGNADTGSIAWRWNLSATPTFYLIDHLGVIRYKWSGPPGEKVLEEALEKLIHAGQQTPR
jgi:hypothetical protein